MLVIKTDSQGQPVWGNAYGGIGMDEAEDVIVSADSNIVLVGTTKNYPTTILDKAICAKIDAAGNVIWSKTYPQSTYVYEGAVAEASDGGFYIAAERYYEGLFIKTDSNGFTNCNENTANLTVTPLTVTTSPGLTTAPATITVSPSSLTVVPTPVNQTVLCGGCQ